jgi:hypothetical protein
MSSSNRQAQYYYKEIPTDPATIQTLLESPAYSQTPDTTEAISEALDSLYAIVQDNISKLPPKQQQVLNLRFEGKGRTCLEVAEIYGCSKDVVWKMLYGQPYRKNKINQGYYTGGAVRNLRDICLMDGRVRELLDTLQELRNG